MRRLDFEPILPLGWCTREVAIIMFVLVVCSAPVAWMLLTKLL